MRRFVVLSMIVATVAPVSLSGASGADDLPVEPHSCGDTIDSSFTLANTFSNCPGDGLIVDAPDIVIDLGGQTIGGTGGNGDTGVANPNGHDNVTVRNGRIVGFQEAILMEGADGVIVSDVVAASSTVAGISLLDGTGARVRNNTASDNVTAGININGGTAIIAAGNDASSNGQTGIIIFDITRNVVERNTVEHNGTQGIWPLDASSNTVIDNSALDNNARGIHLQGNTFGNPTDGNVIKKNDARRQLGELTGVGILLSSGDPSRNAITGNKTSENATFGILVQTGSDNVVKKNKAHENAIHGVAATVPITLVGNKAHRNGFLEGTDDDQGLGIAAPEGTEDKGNTAKGNDDRHQCSSNLKCFRDVAA